jgi:hypothetical protein
LRSRNAKKILDYEHFSLQTRDIENNCLLIVFQVMAGSGNLDVLRIARELHKRHSAEITYGNHMAVHMAIGFLFLSAGRLVDFLM